MQLGARVRTARQQRHLTVAALAEASNLTKGFISQVEAGKSNPSLDSLERIARALQVPLNSFFLASQRTDEPGAPPAPKVVRAPSDNLTGELIPVPAGQSGTHSIVSLTRSSWLNGPTGGRNETALCAVLGGSVTVEQHGLEARGSAGEVLAWDVGSAYRIVSSEPRSTLLLFLPEGAGAAEVVNAQPDMGRTGERGDVATGDDAHGPLRLVAMRARRGPTRRR
jgi:transcriptional regulator with XRE-family HTH domain